MCPCACRGVKKRRVCVPLHDTYTICFQNGCTTSKRERRMRKTIPVLYLLLFTKNRLNKTMNFNHKCKQHSVMAVLCGKGNWGRRTWPLLGNFRWECCSAKSYNNQKAKTRVIVPSKVLDCHMVKCNKYVSQRLALLFCDDLIGTKTVVRIYILTQNCSIQTRKNTVILVNKTRKIKNQFT